MICAFPHNQDTICALATPPGEGAISLIRISGKNAFAISRKLCPFLPAKIKSHFIYFGTLVHPKTRKPLDQVLALSFKKGRSFTGEESLEISCHGGSFIASSILQALQSAGARLAEKGEFSYRAFMNDKMDLIQAENVLELIQSRSPKARDLALRGLKGKVSSSLKNLEKKLLKLLSHIEASIDFSAQDIEPFSVKEQESLLKEIKKDLEQALLGFEQGKINREGFLIVLQGAPNAGKSSLFNYLVQEDKAIVTEKPGTTRDILSARVLWNQREFCLKDTAGFRKNPDPVEKQGMEKALKEIDKSDLCFFLVESGWPLKKESFFGLKNLDPSKTFILLSKSDKLSFAERKKFLQVLKTQLKEKAFLKKFFWISSQTGEGVLDLKKFLYEKSEKQMEGIFLSTPRQGQALREIKHFLEKAEKLFQRREKSTLQPALRVAGKHLSFKGSEKSTLQETSPEFKAFELQSALSVLYRLLGKEYNEEVIEQIFKEFCIGK